MGAYKLFWMGCEKRIHGVRMLVADRWIEKVLDVKRVSERLMVMRVIVGRSVLNLISVYAPQLVKEEFLAMLGEVVSGIDSGERLLICGDLNGHVGCEIDGFEGLYGGFGFGKRNVEGEMMMRGRGFARNWREDEKGSLFGVAKQLVNRNRRCGSKLCEEQ